MGQCFQPVLCLLGGEFHVDYCHYSTLNAVHVCVFELGGIFEAVTHCTV